ncbi:MAG: NAD(P)(+) transhydrogenase (Re/Si-specific) subunit beta [Holosporaceae bacterium]|jgi:NAD(P) transhydrogenase subunit beta|nr:NAD(P)(+) transhydrogenase (Re/Si-specific) subunit beta [Holosporaceae bacterium]
MAAIQANAVNILYLTAAICFIFSLKGLSSPESAHGGNGYGISGMIFACIAAYLCTNCTPIDFAFQLTVLTIIIGGTIGISIAQNISMTSLPQMIAGFHSLVGLAAVLIAFSVYYAPWLFEIVPPGSAAVPASSFAEMSIGAAIGAITFSGSVVAFLKLHGIYKGHRIPLSLNAFLCSSIVCLIVYFVTTKSSTVFLLLTILAFIFGAALIMPVGGADMPVVVSMLNSYSGWAASGIGFTLHNDLLIITGALVGASGAILSYIMCKGMNRSLINVIFTPEPSVASPDAATEIKPFKQGSPEDAAFILKNAASVIVVPGYGMATSQAQHALREMVDLLKKQGINVKYAIHPVAGRMPGHMNVLLAEANVPYEEVFELDEINRDFSCCDVAYVIGANDVTNPAAKKNPGSSIYGMPILDVEKAKVIMFLKRSMGTGYAGVDNELFYSQNTMMLLGDAKKTTEAVVKAI